MPVLGTPTSKCVHGVFKAGEPIAKYCSFCNPESALQFHRNPRPLTITAAKSEVEDEVVLDCCEFQNLNVGQRLAVLE